MKKEKFTGFSNLKTEKLLKQDPAEPIFYHHAECDCIKCRARTEKGGLDYDPTNDDEEFEEHERQVFRDVRIDEKEEKMGKPTLQIIGKDGNVFNILGLAIREARRAGWSKEKIEQFQKDATSGDYDNVLRLCSEHFDVV